jgi:co-chaperonin GroES (HSP10)
MPELDFESAIQTNWIKLGTLEMEATGSKLIVVQDEFHSGYECTTCRGQNVRSIESGEAGRTASTVTCPDCNGNGMGRIVTGSKCKECQGAGWIVCPDCGGKGGVIVFSQDSERRPTTGTIVSIGEKIVNYKRGDSVIYPSFAGDFFDLEAVDVNGNEVKVTIGILGEQEIIARVRGHLELRRVKGRKALHTAA